MFHHNTKLLLLLALLTTFAFCSSTTTQAHTNCNRTCGQRSLQYPFGFSSGCQVKLNCSQDHTVKISHLDVQRVTSQSIFVTLPVNCNRSVESIYPLFGDNYAPTWNNSFHVHNCKSKLGGCVIPPRSFGGEAEGCDNTSGAVICVTQLQRNGSNGDFQTIPDWLRFGCKFVFSALAFAKITVNEVSIQFQTVELGWWLSGRCNASSCSANASCDSVHLAGGNLGFRCRCRDGFVGDGFANGKGCQKDGVPTQSNASTRCSHGYRKAIKIGLLVGGIILGAILLSALSLLCNFSRRRSSWLRKQVTVKRLLREAAGNSTVPLYPYKEIERATSFFSDKHRLGTGAFGTVYAGHLHNDEWVAIKKIKYRDTNSVDQVMNEIKLLSSVSHPNLVRLLGCCIEGGEQILVYEYMPNGTLSEHLQRERGGVLPWTRRLTIATETANAIAYLHSAIDPPIYHRDIKSSNILLDYNCQSKVADFGLSRLGMTEISHISTAPQGTPGYVDPQYHQNFHLSDKSDVYSFGVVLVEIITAMKVVDFGRPQSEINLAALAVDRIRRGCIDDIIDPFLEPHRDAWTLYSLHKVAELAFRCLAFHSDMRPTMIEVAEELELIRRSGWAAMEETLCTASSVGSVCSSPRNGSAVYLRGVSFERDAGHGNETLIVQHKTDSFLQSIEEVKDSSPVSVHGTWLSGTSSPSTNSLLGNVVQ